MLEDLLQQRLCAGLRVAKISKHCAHQAFETVKLRLHLADPGAGNVPDGVRFNLTGNAAGVFAGGDFPGVRAADDTSALPSGNSADVVSRVGVSYVAVVVAILDNGGIEPGDTAEVRDINEGFLLQGKRR